MLLKMFKTIAKLLDKQMNPSGIAVEFNQVKRNPENLEIHFIITFKCRDKQAYDQLTVYLESELKGTLAIPEHIAKQLDEVEKQL